MNSSSLNWIQLVGYAASLLVFSTFYMKTMIPLRSVAIASNVAFLTYGYFASLYPVFLLHLVLLPLNVLRLRQMYGLKERLRRSLERREMSLEWMLPFVKRESFKAKEPLFHKGDAANKLYYLERGTVSLPEVDRTVHAGDIVGEMGVFSPFKERTASASLHDGLDVPRPRRAHGARAVLSKSRLRPVHGAHDHPPFPGPADPGQCSDCLKLARFAASSGPDAESQALLVSEGRGLEVKLDGPSRRRPWPSSRSRAR